MGVTGNCQVLQVWKAHFAGAQMPEKNRLLRYRENAKSRGSKPWQFASADLNALGLEKTASRLTSLWQVAGMFRTICACQY